MRWFRNLFLSELLKRDLRTDASCTMLERANGDKVDGRLAYKLKNRVRVSRSRKAGLQLVGICTVHRSSDDSSVDVPMKSKVKQLCESRNNCLSSSCYTRKAN